MTQYVNILRGSYRGVEIVDTVFPVIKPLDYGKKGHFITVDGTEFNGRESMRVRLEKADDADMIGEGAGPELNDQFDDDDDEPESLGERKIRVRRRFEILDTMVDALIEEHARGLIVSGPPGIGKSFGIENALEEYEITQKISGDKPKTEVVKGSMTPIGLYQALYERSGKGDIIVFDDCDTILFDEQCLNMLKAVLDSGKKRRVSWRAESRVLQQNGVPDSFEFQGSVIFITNVKFDAVRSRKIRDHLEALMSRCHYLDMAIDSVDDLFARIRQVVEDGMLNDYDFSDNDVEELIDFMHTNAKRMREISLRMVLKCADLKRMAPSEWKELAAETCMKRK
jgi:hypothetical protein